MNIQEDYERTQVNAKQALALMKKNKTPATPHNYELWYNYTLGQDKNLIKAVNKAVSQTEILSSNDAAEIYNSHVSDRLMAERVDDLSQQMSMEAEEITAMVKASLGATNSYGDSMESISGKLGKVKDAKQLKMVLGSIVTATRDMEENTRELENKLEKSQAKIADLNQDLKVVRSESLTDALTGISNRKHFDERMDFLTQRASEKGHELSLVIGDIDLFKKFNDSYGHQTGDQVLRLVAHSIKSGVKGRDVAARYGGEEFAIIMPQTNLRDAGIVANQIRKVIKGKDLVKRSTRENLGNVTISFGIARYVPGESVENLIQRADTCLYAAKKAGRNRVMDETEPGIDMSMVA